jgi:hypothetical protein
MVLRDTEKEGGQRHRNEIGARDRYGGRQRKI